MTEFIPDEIAGQVGAARAAIERHPDATPAAIHLFRSALDGGLKSRSDIDLLVTVAARPDEAVRHALMHDLLAVSAPPHGAGGLRALEITVVAHGDVMPWRHPARRELQFGEWLRRDLEAGIVEPPLVDHDLAILLRKTRQHSVALFEPVPARDFVAARLDTVARWNAEPDWRGGECNVVLALARIGYSAATGTIAPRGVAAARVLACLPHAYRPVVAAARGACLGGDAGARQSWPANRSPPSSVKHGGPSSRCCGRSGGCRSRDRRPVMHAPRPGGCRQLAVPANAAFSAASSNLTICIIAAATRAALTGSRSAIIGMSASGTICHDTP